MAYTAKMNSVEQKNKTRMVVEDWPVGTVVDGEEVHRLHPLRSD